MDGHIFESHDIFRKYTHSGGGGGGGGQANMQNSPRYRGVWGHAPPRKFSNLHALRLNHEPSGGI